MNTSIENKKAITIEEARLISWVEPTIMKAAHEYTYDRVECYLPDWDIWGNFKCIVKTFKLI